MKKGIFMYALFLLIVFYTACQNNSSSPTQTNQPTNQPTVPATNTPTCTFTDTPISSPTFTPTSTTIVVIISEPDGDGIVTSIGGFDYSSPVFSVGDNSSNVTYQALLSFDISTLSVSSVSNAKLRIFLTGITGNPLNTMGDLRCEHITTDYMPIDGSEYKNPADINAYLTMISGSTSSYAWKELDVTAQVNLDISMNKTRSQFRLYFQNSSDGNNAWDYFVFISANNSDEEKPQLVITY